MMIRISSNSTINPADANESFGGNTHQISLHIRYYDIKQYEGGEII